jgi:hypothetical protein
MKKPILSKQTRNTNHQRQINTATRLTGLQGLLRQSSGSSGGMAVLHHHSPLHCIEEESKGEALQHRLPLWCTRHRHIDATTSTSTTSSTARAQGNGRQQSCQLLANAVGVLQRSISEEVLVSPVLIFVRLNHHHHHHHHHRHHHLNPRIIHVEHGDDVAISGCESPVGSGGSSLLRGQMRLQEERFGGEQRHCSEDLAHTPDTCTTQHSTQHSTAH